MIKSMRKRMKKTIGIATLSMFLSSSFLSFYTYNTANAAPPPPPAEWQKKAPPKKATKRPAPKPMPKPAPKPMPKPKFDKPMPPPPPRKNIGKHLPPPPPPPRDKHRLYRTSAFLAAILAASAYKHNSNNNTADYYSNNIPSNAYTYNNHHYYLYTNICDTWEEAAAYCDSIGGHLAVIDDEYENAFLYELMLKNNYKSAYFGLSDAYIEGDWQWITGEPVNYTNWDSGEPNNERGKEHYAMFYYKSAPYKWNDGDFGHGTVNDQTVFIGEWDY